MISKITDASQSLGVSLRLLQMAPQALISTLEEATAVSRTVGVVASVGRHGTLDSGLLTSRAEGTLPVKRESIPTSLMKVPIKPEGFHGA